MTNEMKAIAFLVAWHALGLGLIVAALRGRGKARRRLLLGGLAVEAAASIWAPVVFLVYLAWLVAAVIIELAAERMNPLALQRATHAMVGVGVLIAVFVWGSLVVNGTWSAYPDPVTMTEAHAECIFSRCCPC